MPTREVLLDWTLVEDFEVDASEFRTYEYHVVQDTAVGRVTLTIKCIDATARTVRMDPTVISCTHDASAYPDLAERRIRQLYSNGFI